jgi:hypothetical protein
VFGFALAVRIVKAKEETSMQGSSENAADRHEWIPRKAKEEPRVCPKCKSPYWNRPRRQSGK